MVCFAVVIAYCWAFGACGMNQNMPLEKIAKRLEGNWINQEYLNVLRLTQSPQQADEATITKVVQIKVDTFQQLILSFQEGDDWLLDRDMNGVYFSSVFNHKLKLNAKLLSDQKLQLGNKVFLRFKEETDVKNKDIVLVQQILFTGAYDWNGKLVEFLKDGRIKGMEKVGLTTYYPVVHYSSNKEVDQVWLNKGRDNSVKYGFEFKKKKLYFYQLECPDQEVFCGEKKQRGKVLFELNKRR